MYYTGFRIRNFKGIKDTTVALADQSRPGVFTFVGLNESGKTTILEAIHSFAPDDATDHVVRGERGTRVPVEERVPRHLLSSFTGDVSVVASVRMTEEARDEIIAALKKDHDLQVMPGTLPLDFDLERQQRFKGGTFEQGYFSLRCSVQVRSGRQQKWRDPSKEQHEVIRDELARRAPVIAYFPTFVFEFPKRIYLTEGRGDKISEFYREVFQDILDYEGSKHTIAEHVVGRVRSQEMIIPWPQFIVDWKQGQEIAKVQQVMDRASAVVTKVVMGRWSEIFHEEPGDKEVQIVFDTAEGERVDPNGAVQKTNEHDLHIKFQIKDGANRFDVNDRSLGFRWFFSFLLFTQFRVAREGTRPILFLFDEPASNLHAAAQQKLLDSFPEIATDSHTLAYSTHSHYMIDPKWLEQTFIVTNRDDAPPESVIGSLSITDESLDIQATPYRQFVGQHPNQTSYFQPVMDRLHVVPSKFDLGKKSIIVEGKSDYYILSYAAKLYARQDLPLMPAMGAGTFGALIGLHLGWGLDFVALLDSDDMGQASKKKYVDDYGLRPGAAVVLSDLVDGLTTIEDLIDERAKEVIREALGITSGPSKKQISRFCAERLALPEVPSLGRAFYARATKLMNALEKKLNALESPGVGDPAVND